MKRMAEAASTEVKPSVLARLLAFKDDVMLEMKKVTWPTKEELKAHTSVVMLLLAIAAVIIYVYDIFFQITIVGLFKIV